MPIDAAGEGRQQVSSCFLVSSSVGNEPGAPLTVVLDWRALVAPAS